MSYFSTLCHYSSSFWIIVFVAAQIFSSPTPTVCIDTVFQTYSDLDWHQF